MTTHRYLLPGCFFWLLFLATACYESVLLTPVDEEEIPCVHCVLSPFPYGYVKFPNLYIRNPHDFGTLYYFNEEQFHYTLKLCYLKPTGQTVRYEDNAVVTVEQWTMDNEADTMRIADKWRFENTGDGNYRLSPSDMAGNVASGYELRLQVCLPRGDTLTATTVVPPGWISHYDHSAQVLPYTRLSSDNKMTEFDLNGEHYSYERVRSNDAENGHLFEENERTAFVLPAIDYPIWCYKVSYSGYGKDDWFVEDELTASLDGRVDPFNRTGTTYKGHTLLPGKEAYPELLGRPMHHRYLRFTPSPERDTVTISGDFSGYHYGCSGLQMQEIYYDHFWKLYYKILDGEPFAYDIITSGHGGYLVFKTVSPDYDRYLKEVAEYELLHDVSTDIIGIYQNTNTYTNINGGVGIFGAEVIHRYCWTNAAHGTCK